MTNHTYAGRTLDEIKAAAEAATPGPWDQAHRQHDYLPLPAGKYYTTQVFDENGETIANMAWHRVPIDGGVRTDRSENALYIATANPATVLAMAARLKELERELTEAKKSNTHAGLREMYQRAAHERDAARLEGFRLARGMAMMALFRAGATLPAPDAKGTIESAHNSGLCCALAMIDAMNPLSNWLKLSENFGKSLDVTNADWPQPDGFAGGLTEQQK